MAKISISLAVLLVLAQGTCAYIWERTKTVTEEERFQKIPPENETAIKFTKHFIGFDSEAIPPRAVSSHSLNYDAVFVIDSSKSITQEGHKKSLRSLRLLIEKTGAGPRFAAISYSSEATLRYNFTRKKDAIEKLNVREIPFEGGDTNTQAALDLCTTLILNPRNGARGGVPKRVLIITDGQSNMHKTKTLYRGLQLKNAGAQVFVIAVGKYIKGINEIVSLASSTDGHLYRVRDTNGLLRIVKLVPPWKTIKSFMQRTWLSQMLGKKPQPFSSREPRHHHKKRM